MGRQLQPCGMPGCARPCKCRGLCDPHYKRARRAGIAPATHRATVPAEERFFAQVDKTPSGCWAWTGYLIPGGYGYFTLDGRKMTAHRAAHVMFIGPIPDGQEVDHVCHTADLACPGGVTCPHRRCVNPAHLEVVTRRENMLRSRGFVAVNAVKTQCPQGHPYDEVNTYLRPDRAGRGCRICRAESTDQPLKRAMETTNA
jgi:hypothetical protein